MKYLLNIFTTLKTNVYPWIIAGISSFVPTGEFIMLMVITILLDFATAAYVARKANIFKSARVVDTIYKFIIYMIAIILAQHAQNVYCNKVDTDWVISLFPEYMHKLLAKFTVVSGIASIIFIRELSSIDENWEKAFGWSVIKTFNTFIGERLESFTKILPTKILPTKQSPKEEETNGQD